LNSDLGNAASSRFEGFWFGDIRVFLFGLVAEQQTAQEADYEPCSDVE
jgi:hypothetical protein